MLKNKENLNKVVESSNGGVLLFLEEFLNSTNNAYTLSIICDIQYLVSMDKNTRISMCQTAFDKDDVSCRIEAINGSYLSFITKKNDNSVLNLNCCILVNNNLYKIKFCESEQKRYIRIYKNVNISEVDPYKQLDGYYTEVLLDKEFELNDNSNNIGLTHKNASLLGRLWSSPEEIVNNLPRQKVKRLN